MTTKTDPDLTTKLPNQPSIFQRSTVDYPNISGHAGWNGDYVAISQDTSSPNTAAVEHFGVDGSYTVTEINQSGKSVTHRLNPGHEYEYAGGGKSSNIDSHLDVYVGGNFHLNVKVDTGHATSGNTFLGTGGTIVEGAGGDGNFETYSGGSKYFHVKGDFVSQHDSNQHVNTQGDHIESVGGNKYSMITGDCGFDVSGGSFDVKVEGGKAQIQAAQSITFKVGSSTILIEDGKITITAGAVEFVKA